MFAEVRKSLLDVSARRPKYTGPKPVGILAKQLQDVSPIRVYSVGVLAELEGFGWVDRRTP